MYLLLQTIFHVARLIGFMTIIPRFALRASPITRNMEAVAPSGGSYIHKLCYLTYFFSCFSFLVVAFAGLEYKYGIMARITTCT